MAPNSAEYEEENNHSIVIKLTHGDVSFLFTGDACNESEKEMISNYDDELKSTVLKVGHHGSSTSTTPYFFYKVSPEIAIISVGKNSYNHPADRVLRLLTDTKTFRTDEKGTVIVSSDSKKVDINYLRKPVIKPEVVENSEPIRQRVSVSKTVYVTKTGSKYHNAGCRHLSKSSIPMSLESAKLRYSPCSVCKP